MEPSLDTAIIRPQSVCACNVSPTYFRTSATPNSILPCACRSISPPDVFMLAAPKSNAPPVKTEIWPEPDSTLAVMFKPTLDSDSIRILPAPPTVTVLSIIITSVLLIKNRWLSAPPTLMPFNAVPAVCNAPLPAATTRFTCTSAVCFTVISEASVM